ncbi:MAG: CRISPR-associated endoribonuclease Cas6 [Candidatus Aenigmatarchaeota archaeon]|nr:CRISPR-associated endoribonuclease Cas6 [Methanothermobacter sp.]
MIYYKIADKDLAMELHKSDDYKFFTFSEFYVMKRRALKDYLLAENGEIGLYISSPNEEFIKNLVEGFLTNPHVTFLNKKMWVEKVALLRKPKIKKRMKFRTLSPIIVRTLKEKNGKLKQWDLNPADLKFYENLQKNLINKYTAFHGEYKGDEYMKIFPETRSIKRKRIKVPKEGAETYHRAYHMRFEIEADPRLLEFAYDCGLGEKNSMGFGMVAKV